MVGLEAATLSPESLALKLREALLAAKIEDFEKQGVGNVLSHYVNLFIMDLGRFRFIFFCFLSICSHPWSYFRSMSPPASNARAFECSRHVHFAGSTIGFTTCERCGDGIRCRFPLLSTSVERGRHQGFTFVAKRLPSGLQARSRRILLEMYSKLSCNGFSYTKTCSKWNKETSEVEQNCFCFD